MACSPFAIIFLEEEKTNNSFLPMNKFKLWSDTTIHMASIVQSTFNALTNQTLPSLDQCTSLGSILAEFDTQLLGYMLW